jgi:hypothetical protein
MGVNASSASTRRSWISSTTSRTSASPPHHHLPPGTRAANQQEWEAIIKFLKEERSRIRTLRALLDMAENNDVELQGLYKDSPVTADADWGMFAWGPMPQWEEPPPVDNPADDPPPA